MKLKFKQHAYQTDVAMATAKCFEGQSKGLRKEVTGHYEAPDVLKSSGTGLVIEEIFSNNKLELTEDEILANVQENQKEQGLKVSNRLAGLNFTIEKETGTGKPMCIPKQSTN